VIAIRLFAIDHENALPATLSALIPKYLAALPADPMRADGGSFGYLSNASPPILYSAGYDGKDDLGRFRADAEGTDFVNRWAQADAVYSLEAVKRSAPATTSPALIH